MAASTQTEEQVSLKLLVNRKTNKVLFAEAGKDFVDVLFSFLTLPLGTIARLVQKESNMEPVTVGCLNSLYQSVENLDQQCLWTATFKEMLLQPRNSSEDYCRSLKLNIDDTQPIKYFICTDLSNCRFSGCLSSSQNKRCGCGNLLARSVSLKNFSEGFVNCVATFIITDDLTVMPNSMDHTSLCLFQNLGLKSIGSVKEMTVKVTKEKVLDLLKSSLFSKSTLTDLFIEKKPFLQTLRFSPCSVEYDSNIQIDLKLVIRKSDGKILYAQGEENFANFLLTFLTFPLGGVVRILGGDSSMGCIDGLYKSIVDLDENKYFLLKDIKKRLVDPCVASQFELSEQILPIDKPHSSQYYCYRQGSSSGDEFYITDIYLSCFSYCKGLKLVDPESSTESSRKGFVKGPAIYFATDDLMVAPMSPISAICLLISLETPLSDLKEKVVTIGIKEVLNILKASLTSTYALTNGLSHLLSEG